MLYLLDKWFALHHCNALCIYRYSDTIDEQNPECVWGDEYALGLQGFCLWCVNSDTGSFKTFRASFNLDLGETKWSSDQSGPGWLFDIRDDILPNYMGIYWGLLQANEKPISLMKCHVLNAAQFDIILQSFEICCRYTIVNGDRHSQKVAICKGHKPIHASG